MKFRLLFVAFFFMCSIGVQAAVGPTHVVGSITNITGISDGLLIRVGANETPENCTSTNVWMKIPQTKTAMTSLTLTAWTLGRDVVVYTNAASSSYCEVNQVDPYEQ